MTAPGWWCPTCGHTQAAPVADQPDPEPPPVDCSRCGEHHLAPECRIGIPVGVPVGDDARCESSICLESVGREHTIGEHEAWEREANRPVSDDTPAPTAARWTVDRGGRWTVEHVDDADTLWWEFGTGEAMEPWDALDASDQLNDQFTPAYDALVALVRRAGAAPDLTAVDFRTVGDMANVPYAQARAVLAAVAALVREDTP